MLISAVATIAGCAVVYEGRYAYDAGWRQATITDVGRAAQIHKPATLDCRDPLSGGHGALFARVTYHAARNIRSAIVPLNAPAEPGRVIFVNVTTCDTAFATESR